MALRDRRRDKEEEKILDVDAAMQGTLVFRDPVNLRINGRFEGSLDTKGNLTIGEKASVEAKISGESIVIAGTVKGDVVAKKELRLASSARMIGDIETPVLSVIEGALLQGNCRMIEEGGASKSEGKRNILTVEELAKYLDMDDSSVLEWANMGKIPAFREANTWKFEKSRIDEWIVNEKIK